MDNFPGKREDGDESGITQQDETTISRACCHYLARVYGMTRSFAQF